MKHVLGLLEEPGKCTWDPLMEVSIYVSTDGMFGKCHSVPVKEVYTYDVSPPVVQHFKILLEKLSNRDNNNTNNKYNFVELHQIYSDAFTSG
uniref:Uncharacterized protein n=1 Tax=Oryzias melastigma TaxID=30732 RepID=A0A3B3C4U3_ORYME